MAVTRSPKYPQFSLMEAIERVKKIYAKEKWHPATEEVLVQQMGYKGLNGASLGSIATLKRYGLLIPAGESEFRVSDNAVTIIEAPKDNPEWKKALTHLAFHPPLFAELKETFGYDLPSDANLRHYLIKKKFNPNAAEEVIKVYRENLETVLKEESNTGDDKGANSNNVDSVQPVSVGVESQDNKNSGIPSSVPTQVQLGPNDVSYAFSESLTIRLSSDCKAHIQYEGLVTQEAIKKLIKYLELGIDDYPFASES